MITQYVEVLPEGKTTPDFTRKPIALTIQEGKLAFFKAVVTGDPKPTVTWKRNKGDVSDPEKYQPSYDEQAEEYIMQFVENLSNLRHIEVKPNGSAEFEFEMDLKNPLSQVYLYKIVWMGKNVPLEQGEKYDITVSEDKLIHKLVVKDCMQLDKGIYAALAGIKCSSAWLIVEADNDLSMRGKKTARKTTCAGGGEDLEKIVKEQQDQLQKDIDDAAHMANGISEDGAEDSGLDPPRFDLDALGEFSKPVIVRAGEKATFKMPFMGRDPMKVLWYKEDEELLNDTHVKLETTLQHSRLLLSKCQRKDTGEVKIKIKNEFGTIEATSKLIVLDRPTPPLGPVEVIEGSANCIEFKWRPPKDDGGSPVTNYNLERQQVGRNSWKKIGDIPGDPQSYRDTDVDHGRRYCYRIRAVTAEGISEMLESEDIKAGTKAYPGPPAPPKVVSAFKDCINLSWTAPTNTGGTNIVGYNLEKRKKGSNIWSAVNPVEEPIKGPPGKVINLKVTDSTYTTVSLAWTKPTEEKGVQDEVKGYFVEIRPIENTEWSRCNNNAITMTSFTIKGLKSMAMYWVRVIATNDGGEGEPQELDNYIIAMPPPVSPKITDSKLKTFMVVRIGYSVRVNINFKRVTISNTDGGSQLLIPTSERSDTGIYTIVVKNMVGQETFSVEIRVTDDPKPPGPVELEENVRGTVTLSWTESPDEKRDDRLHYMVSKRDSVKQTWNTVADRLFNNKFTACNILPGREYYFRVYAKNDMGLSEPSASPTWGTEKRREKFTVTVPLSVAYNFETPPSFLVPLKIHTAPEGYECYMTCAVRGDPAPHITWYRDNISINTNTNYLISNTCGVCSMLILRVDTKDMGEYKVTAENPLGRAECSTKLTVRVTEILVF
ncbi:hypothetical protein AAFF_G00033450 [Aldrovandia affinis]|uniref:Titin n=1 Tax=Aldrovandia affinis TaxID=143900 RepID=A0AAD7S3R8_9TELE|nr:hypothetical protein AAFF_G00033450 [Aldrovandia affinis]